MPPEPVGWELTRPWERTQPGGLTQTDHITSAQQQKQRERRRREGTTMFVLQSNRYAYWSSTSWAMAGQRLLVGSREQIFVFFLASACSLWFFKLPLSWPRSFSHLIFSPPCPAKEKSDRAACWAPDIQSSSTYNKCTLNKIMYPQSQFKLITEHDSFLWTKLNCSTDSVPTYRPLNRNTRGTTWLVKKWHSFVFLPFLWIYSIKLVFPSHKCVSYSNCDSVNKHVCSYLHRHIHNAYLLLLFYT